LDFKISFQDDPEVKMLVLLGEVGGVEEYRVCEALKSGRINKPMVAWCIGTCGDMFTTDVQVKTWIFSFLQLLFTKKVSFRLTFALDKV
jgi:succinyl-CoA synthetase alpha subunit